MNEFFPRTVAFLQDDTAASSIEYALLVGLIAVALVAAATNLGNKLANTFGLVTNALPGSSSVGGCR